jgi:2-alkenal reductase
VWDKDGHIVTNNHVVSEGGATPNLILVTFKDGTRAKAEIVGRDPQSDLAVIKVDVPSEILKPVKLGDSDALKVGQRVEAIGNPFGYEQGWTMTEGIISALGRTLPTANSPFSIPQVIQTDAAINPGNSGGPLLDDSGRVIGVNSAIKSEVRANAGIGFAIPANLVKRVVPALISTGKFEHPWVGISGTTLTSDLAQAMGLPPSQRGALIINVVGESPADKAGLRGSSKEVKVLGMTEKVGGDVIVAADGHPVTKMGDLLVYLEEHKSPGDTIDLTVLRDGKEKHISLTLGKRPKELP